jgi:hypothetical protein
MFYNICFQEFCFKFDFLLHMYQSVLFFMAREFYCCSFLVVPNTLICYYISIVSTHYYIFVFKKKTGIYKIYIFLHP